MIGSIIANWTCCTCNLHRGENLSESSYKMAMIQPRTVPKCRFYSRMYFNTEDMVDTQIYKYSFKNYVTTLCNGDTIVQKPRRGKKGFVFCEGKLL